MSSPNRVAGRAWPDVAVGVILVALALLPLVRDRGVTGSAVGTPDAPIARAIEATTRRGLGRGELPLWDPLQFGGRPLFANADNRVLYPPFAVLRFLPLRWFFPVLCVVHLWIAGFGVYLCCRALDIARLASGAGAAAVVIAALADVGLPYSNTSYAIAWLPWVFLLAGRSVAHRSIRDDTTLVIVAAIGMLASQHAWWYVMITAAAAYLLQRSSPSLATVASRHLFVRWATLMCVASGLAAFQLLPSAALAFSRASSGGSVQASDSEAGQVAARAAAGTRAGATLTSGPHGRLISACEASGPETMLVEQGWRTADGRHGSVSADYRDAFDLLDGQPSDDARAGALFDPLDHTPTRPDLLRLFDVEYLLSCDPPGSLAAESWTPVMALDGQRMYRATHHPQPAVWTCGVRAVGRRELQALLSHRTYDDGLMLLETGPPVNVRWVPQVDDVARRRLEARFRLAYGQFVGERTWRYRLLDTSGANISALVTNAAVEDTAGLDRGALSVKTAPPPAGTDEPKSEWVVGLDACPASSGSVETTEEPNGDVVMNVSAIRDGVLFVSDPYEAQRAAWVDGRRVRRLKVDLAFTGIRVSAGRHRVEVRADDRLVWAGAVVSALTAVLALAFGMGARDRS